jgi:L-threonylcarbamoyladenylate synthase
MPSHPVALELIRLAGVPVAAPSANPFTGLSPTTAAHVGRELRGRVDCVLDGGPAPVGIESTVLSLAPPAPVLLRPGVIARPELEALAGPVAELGAVPAAHPSPGLHRRHYAPRTPLVLVEGGELPAGGRGAYVWYRRRAPAARDVKMADDAAGYAANLYLVLHELDAEEWDWIAVECPPPEPAWAGVRDRLRRAARRP